MKYRIDTHMHTTASDGTLYPKELLQEIKDKEIDVFSVTDHDSIENIESMKKLTENLDVFFIPGVEISVTHLNKEIHLLVYGNNINKENEGLMEIINANKEIRNNFENRFMDFISDKYDISLKEYANYKRNPKNGGWKAENFLKHKNIISSIEEIFELVKESGLSMIFNSPKEIIPKLKAIDLTAVIAHPPAYFNKELLDIELLDFFSRLGIDGIECYSPYYDNKENVNYYIDYCKANNLLVMSGSDYHGKFIPTRFLGVPERFITKKELNDILNATIK